MPQKQPVATTERRCDRCKHYRAHEPRIQKNNGGPDPQSLRGLCAETNEGKRWWNTCSKWKTWRRQKAAK